MEKKNEKEKKIFSLKNFEFFRLIALTVICQLCRAFIAKRQRMREGEKKQDKKNIKGSSQERIKWQDMRW